MPYFEPARRVLVVAGTRPECLKLATVVTSLRLQEGLCSILLNSGQHHAMVERTFAHLGISCDRAPGVLHATSLSQAVSALRERIRTIALDDEVALIVAQGDTSTAYAATLASRDIGIPLAHIEAGLRTAHPYRPFPEQLFRRRIAQMARLHYAPTPGAVDNLLAEGVDAGHVHMVGNTIVDLLHQHVERAPRPARAGHTVLLTLHRRENYGRALDNVCTAVLDLLRLDPDLDVVCPVHPNPTVGSRIRRHLSGHARIRLVDPLDYGPFIAELMRASLAITDSGGIQEEAPYLGTPVLVVRENTERPEAVSLGAATLVAPHADAIVAEAVRLLARPRPLPLAFDANAPFGDGRSGARIAAGIGEFLRPAASTALVHAIEDAAHSLRGQLQ